MIATVERLTRSDGKRPHRVTLAGVDYQTFDPEIFEPLQVGQTIDADVELRTSQKNGRDFKNWMLVSWKPATGRLPEVAPSSDSEGLLTMAPAHVWEAKDRRIAMESAYSSAARMMQALAAVGNVAAVTSRNYRSLALAIYQDVCKAGEGSRLGSLTEN